MNITQLVASDSGSSVPPYRKQKTLTVTTGTTSNAITGFNRAMPPTVKISGGTLYATYSELSDIVSSSAVSDAIWEDITTLVTAGSTSTLSAGINGLVLVAGAADRTIVVSG